MEQIEQQEVCKRCGVMIVDRQRGMNADGDVFCYPCCGEIDKEDMEKTGKAMLYLSFHFAYNGYNRAMGSYFNGKLTNWPDTLTIPCRVHKGRHNIAGTRYDVSFCFNGREWHGVCYGENTQITHCKRLKH